MMIFPYRRTCIMFIAVPPDRQGTLPSRSHWGDGHLHLESSFHYGPGMPHFGLFGQSALSFSDEKRIDLASRLALHLSVAAGAPATAPLDHAPRVFCEPYGWEAGTRNEMSPPAQAWLETCRPFCDSTQYVTGQMAGRRWPSAYRAGREPNGTPG